MKKYWIKDLTEKQAIHAPTYKIAKKLCEKFHALGLKWCSDKSYLEAINWLDYGRGTCYEPAYGTYCSREYCEYSKYEILTIDQLYDFDEPLKIEVGKFYKTRDGRKARIYSVEKGGKYPIHGAIESNGIGEVECWKEDGKYYEEVSQFSLDIVSEWEDELEFDVSIIPIFRYLAMDAGGYWRMYSNKPIKTDAHWYAVGDSRGIYLDEKDYPKNYTGSWRDSLHEIKDGKLIKVKK